MYVYNCTHITTHTYYLHVSNTYLVFFRNKVLYYCIFGSTRVFFIYVHTRIHSVALNTSAVLRRSRFFTFIWNDGYATVRVRSTALFRRIFPFAAKAETFFLESWSVLKWKENKTGTRFCGCSFVHWKHVVKTAQTAFHVEKISSLQFRPMTKQTRHGTVRYSISRSPVVYSYVCAARLFVFFLENNKNKTQQYTYVALVELPISMALCNIFSSDFNIIKSITYDTPRFRSFARSLS